MSSPLLINEPPLQVLPSLAKAIGLQEAIVLQQFNYWLGASTNVHDGRRWIYNTYEDWVKQFPFWSAEAIRKIVKSLRDKGVILTRKQSESSWNKTNFYAIDYEQLDRLTVPVLHAAEFTASTGKSSGSTGEIYRMEAAKSTASNRRNLPHVYTETTQETTQEIIPEAPSVPAAPAPTDAPAVVAFRAEPAIAKPVFPAIDEEVEVVEALPAVKAVAAKPARTRKPKADAVPVDETALQAACRAAWGAYSAAYDVRYGALPVRNAKVNAAVKGIVQRLGAEEAPAVAAFFVSNVNDAFVVRACHDIGLLLKSAEAYRTQWATGLAVTQTRARQADQSAANYDAAAEAMALVRARRAARAAQAQQEGG